MATRHIKGQTKEESAAAPFSNRQPATIGAAATLPVIPKFVGEQSTTAMVLS